jgi:hypothetical protein
MKPDGRHVLALTALVALVGCGGRETASSSTPALVSAGALGDACGDSLRPATGAPAQGLWLDEQPNGVRVMARIGPPMPDERTLVVRRPIQTLEIGTAGDTARSSLDTARVSLELLPPLEPLGAAAGPPDSTARPQPAATYAVSRLIRLAAYEPCAPSGRGPRIRYLRRDAAGQIITDVMLHRASEQ